MNRILYVDDESFLLEIGRLFLEETGDFTVSTALSPPEALRLLEQEKFDAIISDYQMPGMDGIRFLVEVRARFGSIPFILFTGKGREEVVIQAINSGVDFYLQKGGDPTAQFAELSHKIRIAIERYNAVKALQESEARSRALIENTSDIIRILDCGGRIIFDSAASERLLGYPPGYTLGRSPTEFIHPDDLAIVKRELSEVYNNTNSGIPTEFRIRKADGSYTCVESSGKNLIGVPGIDGVVITTRFIDERKKAKKALQESRRQLDEMATNIPGVVYRFYVNPDGTTGFDYISQRSRQILGLENDPATFFDRLTEGLDPENRERFLDSVQRAISTKTPWEFDSQYNKPSGEKIWINAVSNPVMENDRLIFDGVIFDKTDQKAADEFIRLLARIADDAPASVTVHDFEGNFLYANEETFRLHGYSREEFMAKKVQEIDVPESAELIAERMQQVRDSGAAGFDVQHFRKDGSVFPLHVNVKVVDWGKKNVLLSIATDITERWRAEKALRESEEFNRALVENLPDYIVVYGPDGKILYANPPCEQLLGYEAGTLVGESMLQFVAEEYREKVISSIAGRKKGDEILPYVIDILTQDGTRRSAIVKGTPIRYHDTPAIHILLIDITERKRAEEALHLANKKLALLAGITRHDINNQITVLQSYLAILEKKQVDLSLKEYIHKARTAALRISSMIQFTKEYETVGVKAPVWQNSRTIVDTAFREVHRGQVTMKNDIPAGLEVFADPLILKVFYNLMGNAMQYGGKITTIRFSVEERDRDRIIVCDDDGVGLPASEKEKIFERGFGKNTGLGLALSREILAITGITIRETGEPGKGARFEMAVPEGAWRNAGRGNT